jgi:hypothetical protein
VVQIGTNGVPFLINTLNRPESVWHRTVRQYAGKVSFLKLQLTDPRVARIRAIRALAVLGPAALPAIPSLSAQLQEPALAVHAVYALSGMGPDGMRALVDGFSNASASAQMQITTALLSPTATYRGPNASAAETNQVLTSLMLQGLTVIVGDPGSPLPIPAIIRLGEFGPTASNAVPALLTRLKDPNPVTRQTTIRALGQIQAQPELVIPALTNQLSDPDYGTQMAAVLALRAYGYPARFQPPWRDGLGGSRRQSVPGTNQPIRVR